MIQSAALQRNEFETNSKEPPVKTTRKNHSCPSVRISAPTLNGYLMGIGLLGIKESHCNDL
ncbi:MAG: hypothetical protein QE263_01005 [Vampirovibrionales bacterium]|nr:hypothetical protein [Vampirovibrionales bacterium]